MTSDFHFVLCWANTNQNETPHAWFRFVWCAPKGGHTQNEMKPDRRAPIKTQAQNETHRHLYASRYLEPQGRRLRRGNSSEHRQSLFCGSECKTQRIRRPSRWP